MQIKLLLIALLVATSSTGCASLRRSVEVPVKFAIDLPSRSSSGRALGKLQIGLVKLEPAWVTIPADRELYKNPVSPDRVDTGDSNVRYRAVFERGTIRRLFHKGVTAYERPVFIVRNLEPACPDTALVVFPNSDGSVTVTGYSISTHTLLASDRGEIFSGNATADIDAREVTVSLAPSKGLKSICSIQWTERKDIRTY